MGPSGRDRTQCLSAAEEQRDGQTDVGYPRQTRRGLRREAADLTGDDTLPRREKTRGSRTYQRPETASRGDTRLDGVSSPGDGIPGRRRGVRQEIRVPCFLCLYHPYGTRVLSRGHAPYCRPTARNRRRRDHQSLREVVGTEHTGTAGVMAVDA